MHRKQTYRCIVCDPTERHTGLFHMLPNSTLPKHLRTAEEIATDDANADAEEHSDDVISSHYSATNSFTRCVCFVRLCAYFDDFPAATSNRTSTRSDRTASSIHRRSPMRIMKSNAAVRIIRST